LMRMGRRVLWDRDTGSSQVPAELRLIAIAPARAFPAKSPPRCTDTLGIGECTLT
jgi:hypothetical protein